MPLKSHFQALKVPVVSMIFLVKYSFCKFVLSATEDGNAFEDALIALIKPTINYKRLCCTNLSLRAYSSI